ncbi:MAG: HEPN domain-containing protein [Alphaproteobacteria bacterium]|nr:HEPN domain-containing protein [Alphaproteobacteria bacterium]
MSTAMSEKKKRGRILKIILFGSFARGTWVDDRKSGYKSDYDILVIVNAKFLADHRFWEAAEDRLMFDPTIKREVQFIVETLNTVNSELSNGQYFFSDIRKDGIALYELKGHKLSSPKPLNEAEYQEIATKYYEAAFSLADDQLAISRHCINEDRIESAAFALHQATEHAYRALLLTLTHYSPATHSIKVLRSLAEDLDQRLVEVWPRQQRGDKRKFELLRRAYVEARYSEHYEITVEELEWLESRIRELQGVVEVICRERLKNT